MKTNTRSNLLYAALIAAAVSTAITTAATIATGAQMLPIASVQAVSPRMSELVANYKAALTKVDTLAPDATTDEKAWSEIEAAFMAAQVALMSERPATIVDFVAKFDALIELDATEGDFDAFRTLSDDAHALAQGAN